MPRLIARVGQWELPHVEMWADRQPNMRCQHAALIGSTTRVAVLGNCFGAQLVDALVRFGIDASLHPAGRLYNTRSIRQETERLFGGWATYRPDAHWKIGRGYIHPMKSPYNVFDSPEKLAAWNRQIDQEAETLFRSVDVVLIIPSLIEAWLDRQTNDSHTHIPHPDIYDESSTQLHRLTVDEMVDDFMRIRQALSENTSCQIIMCVCPIPLHATMTALDVRIANAESKARVRAAASEFLDRVDDVFYSPLYEIVEASPVKHRFMVEDQRHLRQPAVDYLARCLLEQFADEQRVLPTIDTSWMHDSRLKRNAARTCHLARRIARRVRNRLSSYRRKQP